MSDITLSGLYIYPIKSAAGTALDSAAIEARGLQYDRRWMIVNAQGKFMTQRKYPRMALIQVEIDADALILNAPGMSALTIPLQAEQGQTRSVEVWGDICDAITVEVGSSQWLSEFLEVPCHLVYMPDSADRPVNHGSLGPDKQVSFADAYPFLLISEASLQDLNGRLTDPVPMNRFRPNLVMTGCEGFAEDTWATIRIGDIKFQVEKGCTRCSVPTVDQATGVRGKEPIRTLAQYRAWDGQIWFGQNLVQESLGRLKVGDPVTILTSKSG